MAYDNLQQFHPGQIENEPNDIQVSFNTEVCGTLHAVHIKTNCCILFRALGVIYHFEGIALSLKVPSNRLHVNCIHMCVISLYRLKVCTKTADRTLDCTYTLYAVCVLHVYMDQADYLQITC